MKATNSRTSQQNRAMHKFFKLLADELNDAGFTVAKTIKRPLEIPWSEHTVKEVLWKQIQVALTDKESTRELNTSEVSQVYDALNRALSERCGVSVPFPEEQAK